MTPQQREALRELVEKVHEMAARIGGMSVIHSRELEGIATRLDAAITAILPHDGAGEWQPIASCPPKGEMLLYYPAETGRNAKSEYLRIGRNDVPRRATHWHPLPAPPLAAAPTGGEG